MALTLSIRAITPDALEKATLLVRQYDAIKSQDGKHKWHELGFRNETNRKAAYRQAHATLAVDCLDTIIEVGNPDSRMAAAIRDHLFQAGNADFKDKIKNEGMKGLTYKDLPKSVKTMMTQDKWLKARAHLAP